MQPLQGHFGTTLEPLVNHFCAAFGPCARNCRSKGAGVRPCRCQYHFETTMEPSWNHFGTTPEPLLNHSWHAAKALPTANLPWATHPRPSTNVATPRANHFSATLEPLWNHFGTTREPLLDHPLYAPRPNHFSTISEPLQDHFGTMPAPPLNHTFAMAVQPTCHRCALGVRLA